MPDTSPENRRVTAAHSQVMEMMGRHCEQMAAQERQIICSGACYFMKTGEVEVTSHDVVLDDGVLSATGPSELETPGVMWCNRA